MKMFDGSGCITNVENIFEIALGFNELELYDENLYKTLHVILIYSVILCIKRVAVCVPKHKEDPDSL